MTKNAGLCRLVIQELTVAYETSVVWHCLRCININKNNYHEETELNSNPRLTLVQTLTLSTREFGYFIPSLCYDTTIFNFAYMSGEGSRV